MTVDLRCLSPVVLVSVLLLPAPGCSYCRQNLALLDQPTPAPATLGAISDSVWQQQEAGAEASNYTVYQHEFVGDTARLNTGGKDHLKQIATRLHEEEIFPVVVEASVTGKLVGEADSYPVHPDPKLDMQRREIVVRSLQALGINDADGLVVVAPAFSQPARATEAMQTLGQFGLGGSGSAFGGGGGFGGGGFGPFRGFGGGGGGGGVGIGGGGGIQ